MLNRFVYEKYVNGDKWINYPAAEKDINYAARWAMLF